MTRIIEGIHQGIFTSDFIQSFVQVGLECSLGMGRLEGARKCGGCLNGWESVGTVWGRAGMLASHGGFQFEYSVEKHTKKIIECE
jgi:hypothetical protein